MLTDVWLWELPESEKSGASVVDPLKDSLGHLLYLARLLIVAN